MMRCLCAAAIGVVVAGGTCEVGHQRSAAKLLGALPSRCGGNGLPSLEVVMKVVGAWDGDLGGAADGNRTLLRAFMWRG